MFKRIAAGNKINVLLIAANFDTLFIVISCNQDINESRLERYLAFALEADVDPVVILTKVDPSDDPESFRTRVLRVNNNLYVELVNAQNPESPNAIRAWITARSTVALVG